MCSYIYLVKVKKINFISYYVNNNFNLLALIILIQLFLDFLQYIKFFITKYF